ncbi:MAG TPA: HEAT repeat domain-containing protein [Terricaulis sp.]|nr:HEAT repeat domain-containing protein [Terricaulis sp.]
MGPFADGWDEAKVEAVLARGDPEELLYAPIVVSLDPPDCAWAFSICKQLADHADPRVRANAILGFGHLARTCGALERDIAPLIEAALGDPEWDVRAKANDAAHDINHFLGWSLKTLD